LARIPASTDQPHTIKATSLLWTPTGRPTHRKSLAWIDHGDPGEIAALALEDRKRLVRTVINDRRPFITRASKRAAALDVRRQQRARFIPRVEALEFPSSRNRGLQSSFVVKRRAKSGKPRQHS